MCGEDSSHQVVLGFGHIRIIWAEPRLVDLQSTAVVVFHLLVLALILAEQGQVVQLFGYIRVIFSKDLVKKGKQIILGVGAFTCDLPHFYSCGCFEVYLCR